MASQSHYQTLGLDPSVSAEEIRKTYRKLARTHHPDRVPSGPERLKAEERFTNFTEAFNVLSDAKRRKAYDQELRDNAAGDKTEREANGCFRVGVNRLNEGKTDEAIRMFRAAIHLDPEPGSYYAHLAKALQKNRAMGEASRTWEEAIKREPFNSKYHRCAGECAEQAGMKTKARRLYQAALKWDSSDSEAASGLQRCSEGKDKKKSGSLLGNIFKRA